VTLKNHTRSRLHSRKTKNWQVHKRSRRLTERFRDALAFATKLHANQTRKGTDEPYIGHLLGVASLVLQYGGNENEAIAALLHDAVEDQGGRATLRRIKRKFGPSVAMIVEVCSDSFETPKLPWLERKREHLAKIRHASRSVRFSLCRRQTAQRPLYFDRLPSDRRTPLEALQWRKRRRALVLPGNGKST
jgi:(p)ppGpp synthase/HD superfamily hydrolase